MSALLENTVLIADEEYDFILGLPYVSHAQMEAALNMRCANGAFRFCRVVAAYWGISFWGALVRWGTCVLGVQRGGLQEDGLWRGGGRRKRQLGLLVPSMVYSVSTRRKTGACNLDGALLTPYILQFENFLLAR